MVLVFLPNSPQEARFLTTTEKEIYLKICVKEEDNTTNNFRKFSLITSKELILETILNGKNWTLAICGFFMMCTSAGMSGYLPTMVSIMRFNPPLPNFIDYKSYMSAEAFRLQPVTCFLQYQISLAFFLCISGANILTWNEYPNLQISIIIILWCMLRAILALYPRSCSRSTWTFFMRYRFAFQAPTFLGYC